MKQIDVIKDTHLENEDVNINFEELEIINSTLEKIDLFKLSRFPEKIA